MVRRRSPVLIGVVLGAGLVVACGTATVAPPPTAPPTSTGPAATSAPGGTPGTPGGTPGSPTTGVGFDFDRVRLMEPSDLPEGIPVPVPAGGVIDTSAGVFEGQIFAIDYDPRFFPTAVAFYSTWMQREDVDASPLVTFSDEAAGWQMTIDGEVVQVQLSVRQDQSATRLEVLWP